MAEKKPTTGQNAIHFGTDGWRALLDKDFNLETLGQVTAATGQAFRQLRETAPTSLKSVADAIPEIDRRANTLIVGYDCRRQAGQYAAFVASILADQGFEVIVSDRYCPTPALCWTISRRPEALGGIMLTSSHNAAEYLGVKLRMNDGGASPAWFTDQVESLLSADQHRGFAQAAQAFAAAVNGTPDSPARTLPGATWRYADLMSAYLADLATLVQAEVIRTAQLAVVVDPLYGAGRGYLAGLLREMGVQVTEIHGENDPTFGGLHPEPILPWVAAGAAKVVELGAAAVLINDGDADRIGAIDGLGNYVSSHRIISLLIAHLVEDRGLTGRVVRTSAGSNLIKRQCQRLGLELVTRPIGFKWVYQEMLRGDVLIGGEESGGFGLPSHVRERDGLLMALLLVEMMAMRHQTLVELVQGLLAELGNLEYARQDLPLSAEQQATFLARHVRVPGTAIQPYEALFAPLGEQLVELERTDGIMLRLASDAWLLVRPSGTEPLVRVYAEATSSERVQQLLEIGCNLAQGQL